MPRRLITREWWRLHGDTVLLVILAAMIITSGWRTEVVSRERAHDRAEATAAIAVQSAALTRQVGRIDDLTRRLHDAGCKSFDTLHRIIGKRSINRLALRRLGFTDEQINIAADEIQKQKDRDLVLLGDRDPTCPPIKETP